MKILRASKADIDGVAELFNLYRMFYKQRSDLEGAKQFILDRFENKDSVIFLAKSEEKSVGFVQLYPMLSSVSMRRTWILNDLYVDEGARNLGVGQKLLEASITFAEKTGAKSISLETAPSNVQAQRLYEKNNFVNDNTYLRYTLNL
ncbi:GNAT family N-acetyltransferase [Evansella sp. AB-rgal1]|uniref:GNAT family N-acetyltransferase n=1 Tax=Evansella sp. AB-rgal1 TaxID=3242696 RepID=UPI00359DA23B